MLHRPLAALIAALAPASNRAGAEIYDVNVLTDPPGATCPSVRCSLRAAIEAANARPGFDEIRFSVAGVMPVLSALPPVTDIVTINGNSAPGYIGEAPQITVDGVVTTAARGLTLQGEADGSSVFALGIVNFDSDGLLLASSVRAAFVDGCWIGQNADGNAAGNQGGIRVSGDDNTIGGNRGNRIAGSAENGISVQGKGNTISNNLVGGAEVESDFSNGIGINVSSTLASSNRITGNSLGGNREGAIRINGSSNTVSDNEIGWFEGHRVANGGDGIVVTGEGHVIENNNVYAGVRGVVFGEGTLGAEDMTLDNNLLEDQQSHAIDVWQLDGSSLRDNRLVNPGGHGLRMRVGTNNTLVNNVVRDGAADGFFLETSVTRGNLFQRNTLENLPGNGFSLAAAAGVSNYITGNNQRNIAGQWVDLSNDGPTPNDAGDSDDGPNRLQNYPVLSNAVYTPGTELNSDGLVDLDLVLSSDPDQSLYPVIVEFFYLLDGSDFLILRAENARLIETADAGRLIRVTGLQIPGPAPVFPAPDGGFITATAIDAAGNTSEFSPRLEFGTVFDSGFESPDGP